MFKYLFENKKGIIFSFNGAVVLSHEFPAPVDGLYQFLLDVKKDLNVKTALITSLDEAHLNKILLDLELDGYFDLIKSSETLNLHKVAKELELKEKQLIIFTADPEESLHASKKEVSQVIVGPKDFSENAYANNVLEFVTDYTALTGKLTIDPLESLLEQAKLIEESTTVAL